MTGLSRWIAILIVVAIASFAPAQSPKRSSEPGFYELERKQLVLSVGKRLYELQSNGLSWTLADPSQLGPFGKWLARQPGSPDLGLLVERLLRGKAGTQLPVLAKIQVNAEPQKILLSFDLGKRVSQMFFSIVLQRTSVGSSTWQIEPGDEASAEDVASRLGLNGANSIPGYLLPPATKQADWDSLVKSTEARSTTFKVEPGTMGLVEIFRMPWFPAMSNLISSQTPRQKSVPVKESSPWSAVAAGLSGLIIGAGGGYLVALSRKPRERPLSSPEKSLVAMFRSEIQPKRGGPPLTGAEEQHLFEEIRARHQNYPDVEGRVEDALAEVARLDHYREFKAETDRFDDQLNAVRDQLVRANSEKEVLAGDVNQKDRTITLQSAQIEELKNRLQETEQLVENLESELAEVCHVLDTQIAFQEKIVRERLEPLHQEIIG
jgi:hypothetical protein